jgi:hypothetical protein
MAEFTLTLTVSDGAMPTPGSDSADVTIVLTDVEEGPAIANDDSVGTIEDAIDADIPVLLNDDVDPDTGTIAVIAVGSAQHGSVAFDADSVIYTPETDYCGPDSATYTVSGGDTATITIDVQCVNDAPQTAVTLPDRSANELVPIAAFGIAAGFADVDAGDTLEFDVTGLPPGLTLDPVSGVIGGTPAAGSASGSPYAVQITATDDAGASAQQIFQFVVDAALLPPIFADGFED